MSRTLCKQCHRPEKACICAFVVNIDNEIQVVVLQHPTEEKQSKGTVSLLKQSLSNCDVHVGELFESNETLQTLFKHYGDKIALLYPSEQALKIDFLSSDENESTMLSKTSDDINVECIIILDGTWKKAYRMFMLNSCLHQMKHLVLPEGIASLYDIRKTKKENALSSLEACCHALARLENNKNKYQALLTSFVKFNQFQQSFNKAPKSQLKTFGE